jgi:hypothetical protein
MMSLNPGKSDASLRRKSERQNNQAACSKENDMKTTKLISTIFIGAILCVLASSAVSAQSEQLGEIQYTPVKGWTKTANENIVVFSEVNQSSERFCFLTLYGATTSSGSPQKDFAREWNKLVVKPFGAEASPKTETTAENGWTAMGGLSAIDFQGSKAYVFLTVTSGFGKTISILSIFNDTSYLSEVKTFLEAIDLSKATASIQPHVPEPITPAPSAVTEMHAAALVKEFENNEIRANQTYIGKRVRITGTVNTIEIDRAGLIVLTFKSSVSTYRNARCYFNKSQSSRVSTLSAHEQATVEGVVKGLGDGFDNSKAFLVLENCIVP